MGDTLAGTATLQISKHLLRDLGLLFDAPAGGRLPNGNLDTGWNCHAKAYVTTYLARLQGLAADYCEGKGYAVWRTRSEAPAFIIDPHGWAGLRHSGVIDLSGSNLFGHRHYTVGHSPAGETVVPQIGHVSDAQDLGRLRSMRSRLAPGGYLFFFEERRRPFEFYDLVNGVRELNSLPSRQLLGRFADRNKVLAKAVLHLHRVARGEHPPLRASRQLDAWREIAGIDVDPISELEVIWRLTWRGRTLPPSESLRAGPHWTEYLSASARQPATS